MAEFTEKRKYRRVDIAIPLRYKELRGNSYLSKGTLTKNISEGGVRFRTHKFLSLACHLVVEMSLPSIAKPVKSIAKVAWIKKLPAGDDYEVGNQFLAMSNEDESVLSEYMKNLLNEDASL